MTTQGERQFAHGDRLYFLRNDRHLSVKNGTLGTVRGLFGLEKDRVVLSVHWSRDDVGSREGLVARLSRERLKDTTLDYTVRDEDAVSPRRRGVDVSENEMASGAGKEGSVPSQPAQAPDPEHPDLLSPEFLQEGRAEARKVYGDWQREKALAVQAERWCQDWGQSWQAYAQAVHGLVPGQAVSEQVKRGLSNCTSALQQDDPLRQRVLRDWEHLDPVRKREAWFRNVVRQNVEASRALHAALSAHEQSVLDRIRQ
ncbi:hypothetical protein [Gluconobacter sp. DsW_058]|uniref:hypothetical protein n=1 Tax=Gluconobacter TaxID=441 RepID=UPI000B63DCFC|nr:hypothetical protein HK24_01840 [Gluconobacter sp. DsW_058]